MLRTLMNKQQARTNWKYKQTGGNSKEKKKEMIEIKKYCNIKNVLDGLIIDGHG